MRRRRFLSLSAAGIYRLAAQTPLQFFTPAEALDIAAALERIFPGATEARVLRYIDRQLAGPYGRDAYRYSHPPFAAGAPEQGYQGMATPAEIYRQGLPTIAKLHDLSPAEQDAKLKEIETTLFFALLRTHSIEGMFCDPMHGGNANLAGWKLIGFPGPRMSYRDEVDKYHGRAFRPAPVSLEQTVGRKAIEDAARAPASKATTAPRGATTLPPVDIVIVGGGWNGLLMAKELATRTALKVLVLERGGPRKTSDYLTDMDELEYGIRLKMMQDISQETVTFRHTIRDTSLPVRQYGSFLPGSGVGGAGEHWSGISYRYVPDAFELLTRTVERYGAKRLPEDHSIQDWGVTYAELEPYYTRAELMMGISGKAGNLQGSLVEGGNIFEGPRSREYPTPPMKTPYLAELFRDASRSLSYHPYPLPAATTSEAYKNPDGIARAGCSYCGYCERFGCMIGAKAQPTNTLLPIVERRRNFELRTGAWVRRIAVRDGRARGVTYVNSDGQEIFQPADAVFLASWTLNNTRLLLLSQIGRPYNPATGEGNLGRNLTHQISIPAAMAFFGKPLNRFMGAGSAGIAINDFDADVFDHSQLDFIRGGSIYTVCYGFRPMANFGVMPAGRAPAWGEAWKQAALRYYDNTGRISFYGEHLAYRHNYMDLDPTYKDRLGDPLLRLTLDWRDNERRMAAFMARKAEEIARAMGATEITPFPGLKRYDATRYQSTHIQGGTILGGNAARSVVNMYCQHWQVPNLFVLGASAFPQNPSGNPTLTAVALTYRTADTVIERYLKNPGALV